MLEFCRVQLPATLLHVDISGNALTRLDALQTLASLRWLDASHNALKASPTCFFIRLLTGPQRLRDLCTS